MIDKDVVFFHDNCWDGFGAAWAAYKHLGERADYIPWNYGQSPEPPNWTDYTGRIYLVDICARPEVMDLMADARSLTVIDHHASAIAKLSPDGKYESVLDTKRSGAMLTWRYFHPHGTIPKIIDYVQDRDLWHFELTDSKAINTWISSLPFDFVTWDYAAELLERNQVRCADKGEAMLQLKSQQIESICKHSTLAQNVAGLHNDIPIVNSSILFSEVADHLLETHPEAPFAMYYFDRADGKRQYGMRSRSDFNLIPVAQYYGGGGHPQASGFTLDSPEIFN